MPIYHGTEPIETLYYGTTSIGRVYYGSTLVFDKVSGPTGEVLYAVQDFVTGTTTGTQTFTSPTLTGITPKAALVIGALHDTGNDPNETPHASWSVGFVDATHSRMTRGYQRENAATTFTASNHSQTLALQLVGSSTGILKTASGAVASAGISLNFTANPAPSLRSFFLAFAGADTLAKTEGLALGTGTTPIDVATVGFQPSVVLFSGHGYGAGSGNAPMHASFGIVVNDGSNTQRCVILTEASGAADGAPFMSLRNDAVTGKISTANGGVTYLASVGSFDASGFSATPTASAGSNAINYLALKPGSRQVKLVDFTTPTTTGSHTITGAGFTPSFALAVLTNLEAVNDHPGVSSDNMSGWSICVIGSDEQWSASWRSDSGAATTDTASQVANVALMGPSAVDCDAIKASFTEWTNNGVKLNFSAVQGTGKKGFILFVE